jgi:hypothetical protein
MRKIYLDTKLTQRLWRQKSTDLRNDRPVETADDDLITLTKIAVDKDDVDGRAETFNNLDLENSALERRDVHQALVHALLREVDEEHDHVRNTLASNGGRRNEGHVLCEVLVFIVEDGVEALLCERRNGALESVLELTLDGLLLLFQRVLERVVRDCLPAVHSVDLCMR